MATIIICKECNKKKPLMGKGLCGRCYRRLWARKNSSATGLSRDEYLAKIAKEKAERSYGICSTCGKEKELQSLGQCSRCYKKTVGRYIKCKRCGNERKHEARGLCSACYVAVMSKKRKVVPITCAICGEIKRHHAKGLCRKCYTKVHKRTWDKPIVKCAMCGEEKEHMAKGLCSNCYWISIGGRKYNNRRISRKNNLPATLTHREWKEILAAFNNSCTYCGRKLKRLTQDHWIPLSRGGGYTKENIVPACKSCNSRKHAMTGDEFIELLRKEREYAKQEH